MLPHSHTLLVISGMAFEAHLAHGNGIRTIYGLNPAKLEADMEQAIREGAAGFLSFGCAAGLGPTLKAGTIVIAQHIIPPPVGGRLGGGQSCSTEQVSPHPNPPPMGEGIYTADAAWAQRLLAALPEAVSGDIAGVDYAIASAEAKALLHRQTGALAADMESHRAARMAQRYALPFAALRVVLDDAHCTLPPAALAATKADGSMNYKGLLCSLLRRPGQIPALMALSAHHRAATKALSRGGQFLGGGFFGVNLG